MVTCEQEGEDKRRTEMEDERRGGGEDWPLADGAQSLGARLARRGSAAVVFAAAWWSAGSEPGISRVVRLQRQHELGAVEKSGRLIQGNN